MCEGVRQISYSHFSDACIINSQNSYIVTTTKSGISTICTEGPRPHHEEVGGVVVRVMRETMCALQLL